MRKFLIKKSFLLIGSAFVFGQVVHATNCTTLTNWEAETAYNGGNQVQHQSNAYEANWWTQNDSPETHSGDWQEWSLLGSCDTDGENINPTANPNGPYTGLVNSSIAFTSQGSNDSDGHITDYQWQFGDGATSTQANPAHSYSQTGSYTVTLTVTDNDAANSSVDTIATITEEGTDDCETTPYMAGSLYVAGALVSNIGSIYRCEIAGWCSSSAAWAYEPGVGSSWDSAWTEVGSCVGGNQSPIATPNGPYNGKVDQNIAFSSAGSNDPDGNIASYQWSFGDGGNSNSANPSHTYTSTGSYSVTLTVTDNEGASKTAGTTASITNDDGNTPPTVNHNGPYNGKVNQSVAFSSAGSNDPDGSIASYSWNFGDGSSSNSANPSHIYTSTGSYTVTLIATDNDGATGSNTTTANITNNTPPPGGDKKVIGYFAEWGVYGRNYHVKDIVTSGSAEKLTHIMYAFGNVTNGQCVIGDSYADYDKFYSAADSVDGVADTWDAGALRGSFGQIRRLKEMYPHIKVIWSFGGWTWSGGFGQAAANPDAFANSCYDLIFDPRWAGVFDGIDIDWEYPNQCGLSCDNSGFDSYRNLMSSLRSRFGNDKLVTSATTASETKLRSADYGGAAQYVDFYMLMTYDFFGAFNPAGPTAPHSPLHNYSGIPVEGFYSSKAVDVMQDLGVPAEKLLLGIGFYGRGWTGVSQSAPGGTASGAASGAYEPGINDYKVLKNSCPSTGVIAGTAYAKCGSNWWGYDTPATISGKMDYLKQQGMGGAFFWELSGDTTNGELINAIKSGL